MSVESSGGLSGFIKHRSKHRDIRPQFLIVIVAGFALGGQLIAAYLAMGAEPRVQYGAVTIVLVFIHAMEPVIVWLLLPAGVQFGPAGEDFPLGQRLA